MPASRHLQIALFISLILHVLVLVVPAVWPVAVRQQPRFTMLNVTVKPAPVIAEEISPEPLLKNTYENEPEKPEEKLSPPPVLKPPLPEKRPAPVRRDNAQSAIKAAQKKLSRLDFYPQAAIDQGLQGEVHLLVSLDDEGEITAVEVASSSGYGILDDAAVRALRSLRKMPGAGLRELIFPVSFRLD